MRVMLDTCVLSELRRPHPEKAVRDALMQIAEDALFISVLTTGEITKGISLLPDGRKKRSLLEWLAGLERQFGERIVPVDQEAARIWGEITARSQVKGSPLPVVDGLLAATAIRHGMHVMTRNTRHFTHTGALIIDPWVSG